LRSGRVFEGRRKRIETQSQGIQSGQSMKMAVRGAVCMRAEKFLWLCSLGALCTIRQREMG